MVNQLSDKTELLDHGDYIRAKKMITVSRTIDNKGVVQNIHEHRGQLCILKDTICIVDRVVWYARD